MPPPWRLALAAAALMALVAGARAAFGLFVSPLNTATGMGLTAISLALALGQLAIGLTQPLVGALADRLGAQRVIVAGALLLALATALPAAWPLPALVGPALVLAAVAGSAVASNSLLVGEVSRAVPPARAGLAVGLVGVGASLGQLLLGPTTQWGIARHGWDWALLATAALGLLALPLAAAFRRPTAPVQGRGHTDAAADGPDTRCRRGATTAASPSPADPSQAPLPSHTWRQALRQWRFWRVALSFAVCGFHIAFLLVHMPGVIERCGLPATLAGPWMALAGAANIAGSLLIGLLMQRHDSALLLALTYVLRAAGIALFLLLPASAFSALAFALWMGATHMATLPPTAQLVSRQHGLAHMGAIFGVVMLLHQLGSFAGIWLGGWAAEVTGSDTLLWGIDTVLALVAAALVWPARQRVSAGSRARWAAPQARLAPR